MMIAEHRPAIPPILAKKARQAATLLVVVVCAVFAGCLADSGIANPVGDTDSATFLSPAAAWLGIFEGSGDGILGGSDVSVDNARLLIRLDADSVRTASCRQCLTLTFDTLFTLVNVPPTVGVSLAALYEESATRRTLQLDRFSGGGGVDNVLLVRLQITPLGALGERSDMVYVLERR